MEKKIEALKKFFIISNAAFDFMDVITASIGGIPDKNSDMRKLHREALNELNTEKPDLKKIDSLISQMEIVAALSKLPKDTHIGKVGSSAAIADIPLNELMGTVAGVNKFLKRQIKKK